jgi:hypothetical protein
MAIVEPHHITKLKLVRDFSELLFFRQLLSTKKDYLWIGDKTCWMLGKLTKVITRSVCNDFDTIPVNSEGI